ncbi:flocculation protein FLO11 [Polypterus senegalus]|uniref:flocculation protein FLO11 n=1 Tax=Polypterus senegalus TaxID=55291 RepID=UPI0019639BBB|nr:flocculation protein FLO11 [Polypterus senegalus]XP_039594241.1 flocculation protein FLO11 [Polypterus senegalus]XP_039594250.1 flocculation protein FLO11 [Polypterus senegalus]
MLMALTLTQPVMAPQYPPAVLPKPGKDNAKLQKLLKKSAKKKTTPATSQTPVPFRSSLSPVSEASPDLEHSDHSTPPKTPETPAYVGPLLPPRFLVKSLAQHSPSPYPTQRPTFFTKQDRFSPLPFLSPHRVELETPEAGISTTQQESQASLAPAAGPLLFTAGTAISATQLATHVESSVLDVQKVGTHKGEEATSSGIQASTLTADAAPLQSMTWKTETQYEVPKIKVSPAASSAGPRSKTPTSDAGRPKTPGSVHEVPPYGAPPSDGKTQSYGLSSVHTLVYGVPRAKTPTRDTTGRPGDAPKGHVGSYEALRAQIAKYNVPRPKTPTFQVSTYTAGSSFDASRPKTPTYKSLSAQMATFDMARPKTPIYQVSSIQMITSETSRPKTPTYQVSTTWMTTSESSRPKTPTSQVPTTQMTTSDLASPKAPTYQVSKMTTSETSRPKTPTYQVSATLMTTLETSRPKISTYQGSASQMTTSERFRPKTPTRQDPSVRMPRSEAPVTDGPKPKMPTYQTAPSDSSYSAPLTKMVTPDSSTPRTPTYPGHSVPSATLGTSRPKTPTRQAPSAQTAETPTYPIPSATSAAFETSRGSSRAKTPPAQSQTSDDMRPKTPTCQVSSAQIAISNAARPKTPTHQAPSAPSAAPDTFHPKTLPQKGASLSNLASFVLPTKLAVPATKTVDSRTPQSDGSMSSLKTPSMDKLAEPEMASSETADSQSVSTMDSPGAKPPNSDVPRVGTPTKGAHPEGMKEERLDGVAGSSTKSELPVSTPTTKDTGKTGNDARPKAEGLLKASAKGKSLKASLSGWSRLKKHLVVEPEEPKFPEPEPQTAAEAVPKKEENEETSEEQKQETTGQELEKHKDSRATKMWDAMLFQMFSAKEAIKQHINNSKKEAEASESGQGEKKPSMALLYRLPLLLYKPRFDARKLKEAAARPLNKITTAFEMSLLQRKNPSEQPKDFNRVARGWDLK